MVEGRKLFVGIPAYGGIVPQFLESVAAMVAARAMPCKMRMRHGDSLVTRARNSLTADFLESDCTHLLFIDSDLIFTPDDVVRIASHDVDLVGGMYPLKREGELQWCGNGLLTKDGSSFAKATEDRRAAGLQEVRYIGTGFMCVSRHVFNSMILADGAEIGYECDAPPHRKEFDFWRVGVRSTGDVRRRYLSEDWYFCQRWLELGGKVYADYETVLRHVGQAVWPLESQRGESKVEGRMSSAEASSSAKAPEDKPEDGERKADEICAYCGSSLRNAGHDVYVCDKCTRNGVPR